MAYYNVGDRLLCLSANGNPGNKTVGKVYTLLLNSDNSVYYISDSGGKGYPIADKALWKILSKTKNLQEVYKR